MSEAIITHFPGDKNLSLSLLFPSTRWSLFESVFHRETSENKSKIRVDQDVSYPKISLLFPSTKTDRHENPVTHVTHRDTKTQRGLHHLVALDVS